MPFNLLKPKHAFCRLSMCSVDHEIICQKRFLGLQNSDTAPSYAPPPLRTKGSERKHCDPMVPGGVENHFASLCICVCVHVHVCVPQAPNITPRNTLGNVTLATTDGAGSMPPAFPASSGLPQLQGMLCGSPLKGRPLNQDIFLGTGYSHSSKREEGRGPSEP